MTGFITKLKKGEKIIMTLKLFCLLILFLVIFNSVLLVINLLFSNNYPRLISPEIDIISLLFNFVITICAILALSS